jgi:hypothetical protein
VLKTLVIEPMKSMKNDHAFEIISLLPAFNFDEELLAFELTTEPLQNLESLMAVVTSVFTEFVSVPQMLALCDTFGVTSMGDLKMKIAG